MEDKKKSANDKTRRILNIIFGCIALIAAGVTLLLTPFGRRLTGNEKTTAPTTEVTTLTTAVQTTVPSTEDTSSDESSISIPEPTEAVRDPYKNYSVFVDKRVFNFTELQGVTTLTAKDNENVKLTVTPYSNKSYKQLCENTKKNHAEIAIGEEFTVATLKSAYRSQTGDADDDIITTIYCIDNGKGGSIEIKFQTPVNARVYENDFNLVLSMFTLH